MLGPVGVGGLSKGEANIAGRTQHACVTVHRILLVNWPLRFLGRPQVGVRKYGGGDGVACTNQLPNPILVRIAMSMPCGSSHVVMWEASSLQRHHSLGPEVSSKSSSLH